METGCWIPVVLLLMMCNYTATFLGQLSTAFPKAYLDWERASHVCVWMYKHSQVRRQRYCLCVCVCHLENRRNSERKGDEREQRTYIAKSVTTRTYQENRNVEFRVLARFNFAQEIRPFVSNEEWIWHIPHSYIGSNRHIQFVTQKQESGGGGDSCYEGTKRWWYLPYKAALSLF